VPDRVDQRRRRLLSLGAAQRWLNRCAARHDPRPRSGADTRPGDTEQHEVAWCTKSGRGTRTIPNGALSGVHFVRTPDYVQVTGTGDFTKINIPGGDSGGELDPHGPGASRFLPFLSASRPPKDACGLFVFILALLDIRTRT
jgi:hypothetical protein